MSDTIISSNGHTTIWSHARLVIHMLIWSNDEMIRRSYENMLISTCDQMNKTYDHVIVWSYVQTDHMITCPYDHCWYDVGTILDNVQRIFDVIQTVLDAINAIWWYSMLFKRCSTQFAETVMQWFRLQLKRGLFWYRHHPKMHDMVSNRSSRADFLANHREISMRVFFRSSKCGEVTIWSNQKHKTSFPWLKIFEKLHASCQSWKKTKKLQRKLLNLNSFNYL